MCLLWIPIIARHSLVYIVCTPATLCMVRFSCIMLLRHLPCGSLACLAIIIASSHNTHPRCEIFAWRRVKRSRSRSMCINHSKLSGPIRSSKLIKARNTRMQKGKSCFTLIHHQFKFKNVYSISISELNSLVASLVAGRYSDWTVPTVKLMLNYTSSWWCTRHGQNTRQGHTIVCNCRWLYNLPPTLGGSDWWMAPW